MNAYEQRLGAEVEAEVLACIGCNDCLLACPLPKARSVTISELNTAVHLPVIAQQNVREFVDSCTQCEQCVPVCPAGLNRARMVLFNKLKVEDTASDRPLLLQARGGTSPSGWTLDGLAQGLGALELFAGVDPQQLRRMLLRSTLRWFSAHERPTEEGEFHERLSVVLSGGLQQVSRGARGEQIPILLLGPGGFYGEMGVLGDSPEAFGVVALENSIVLEIPKAALLRLMDHVPAFGARLENLYSQRALWSYARNPSAFGAAPEPAVAELLESARLQLLSPGQTVFHQGAAPSDVFLIKSGFVRVKRQDTARERTLIYLGEGAMFGLLSLLSREAAQPYAVEAATRAELIRISGQSVFRVLARYPGLDRQLIAGASSAEQLARADDVGLLANAGTSEQARGSGFDARVLVEQGLAAGREILVVDQQLCVGCGNCIDSCERRHGYSRLQLRGIQVDHYLFPTACRHCDDPACLLCSVGGIARLPSGEIKIIEDNCIGCGACAERCPYGNISMHPVQKPGRGLLFGLLDLLKGSSLRQQALAELDPKLQKVAVKCDLCAGYADYACVTGCPVAAAFRFDPASAFGRTSLAPGAEP